jgi:hypothetical protein
LRGERGWSGVGDISLVCGDATVLPEDEVLNTTIAIRLRDADVVFCNNYVFSVDLEDKIFTMLGQCLKRARESGRDEALLPALPARLVALAKSRA